jgi:hypothetical protein
MSLSCLLPLYQCPNKPLSFYLLVMVNSTTSSQALKSMTDRGQGSQDVFRKQFFQAQLGCFL